MRFGILGWGKIARNALAPAIEEAGHSVVAVGSRAPSLPTLPDLPGVPWLTYEALLASPEVDAVYIALPNHLHVPWTLRALEAGKHVLCEKPMALTVADVELVQVAALKAARRVEEAFMVGHHPQWRWLRDLPLGRIRSMQAAFSYNNQDAGNIRNRVEWGGGALWDIGCYAVFAGQWMMGREPDRCHMQAVTHPEWGTDIHAHGTLSWDSGAVLQFHVSTQSAPHQMVKVVGESGWADLVVPFSAPRQTRVRYAPGGGIGTLVEDTLLPEANHYAEMVRKFAWEAAAGTPTDLTQSRAIAQTLVRLRESAGLQGLFSPPSNLEK